MKSRPADRPIHLQQRAALSRAAAITLAAAAFIYLIHSLLLYSLPQADSHSAFGLMKDWRIPIFYDLRWNLAVTECPIPFDQLARSGGKCNGFPWTGYPYLAFELGKWLSLGVKDTSWIGLISGLALLATLAHQIWVLTTDARDWCVIAAVSLIAFPLQIAIERSNMDVILYVLTALFCVAVNLPGRSAFPAANVLGSILTAFKIYPFFGIFGWAVAGLINRDLSHRRIWLSLSLIATQILVLALVMATLESKMLVKAGQMGSHGLLALGYLNVSLMESLGIEKARLVLKLLFSIKSLAVLLGFGSGLLLFRNGCLHRRTIHQQSTQAGDYADATLIVMTTIGISGYVVTINFDYRLIFFIPILAFLASNLIRNQALTTAQRLYVAALILCATYIGYLPLIFHSHTVGDPFIFELLDEMIAAPFCVSGLSAILLLLSIRPDKPNQARLRTAPESQAAAVNRDAPAQHTAQNTTDLLPLTLSSRPA